MTSGQAIYGSVTLAEITSRINAECGSPLVPPDAIVSLASRGAEKRTKLKALGTYGVEVLLRTGDVVDVEVRVEPKTE